LNRHWAFILALGVSLACCSFISHDASAQSGMDDPVDPGINPPAGDPDLPSNPGKNNGPGKLMRNGSRLVKRTVGDGSVPRSAWVWRLRVVWRGYRSVYFRF
jgi:hypothetical protein